MNAWIMERYCVLPVQMPKLTSPVEQIVYFFIFHMYLLNIACYPLNNMMQSLFGGSIYFSAVNCLQVVNVWESRQKRLTLKQPLYGHMEAVTCLASCQSYNMVVSGSRDKTCIIWDLSRLQFVRQLRGHSGPVAALCINELTVSLLMH